MTAREHHIDRGADAAQRRSVPCPDAAGSGEKLPLGAGGSDVDRVPDVRTRCSSCHRPNTAVVAVDSPRGEYLLCVACLGRDAEPRTVLELPGRRAGGTRR